MSTDTSFEIPQGMSICYGLLMASNFKLIGNSNSRYDFEEIDTRMAYSMRAGAYKGVAEVTMLEGDYALIPNGYNRYDCIDIRGQQVVASDLRKGELPDFLR